MLSSAQSGAYQNVTQQLQGMYAAGTVLVGNSIVFLHQVCLCKGCRYIYIDMMQTLHVESFGRSLIFARRKKLFAGLCCLAAVQLE